MPFFYRLDESDPALNAPRTAANLIDLRVQLDRDVPPKTVLERLLLATWNIQAFGTTNRLEESYWYIAEILSRFDLIAIQEIKGDLSALDQVRALLGDWWDYIVTDVTEGSAGNNERLGFLFDTRKVEFGGIAGEIVLPPLKDAKGRSVAPDQIFRTPFVAGFRAGWFDFMLATAHIRFGKNKRADPARVMEIRQVADFLAKRGSRTSTWSPNLVLLGDFNIFDESSPAMDALLDAGFTVPRALSQVPSSNVGAQPRRYDQIAFRLSGQPQLQPTQAGVLDYFESVYTDDKFGSYAPGLTRADGSVPTDKRRYYQNHWRRREMSDHLLLWAEIPIEFADPYLRKHADAGPSR